MITQPFRPMTSTGPSIMALIANFFAVFLLLGCTEDEIDSVPSSPSRVPSTQCSPPCSGGLSCYQDSGVCTTPTCSSCYARTCPSQNPTESCVDGAICDENLGRCTFEQVCEGGCVAGTHCVAGNCIPNYSSDNICDPLQRCRELCGVNDFSCLAACEIDRSATCETCLRGLERCEAQEECFGNANGCCTDNYCQCFPGAAGCGGRACDGCMAQCTNGGSTDTACFNRCANANAACASCLQPMNNTPECLTSNPPDVCTTLFYACVTP